MIDKIINTLRKWKYKGSDPTVIVDYACTMKYGEHALLTVRVWRDYEGNGEGFRVEVHEPLTEHRSVEMDHFDSSAKIVWHTDKVYADANDALDIGCKAAYKLAVVNVMNEIHEGRKWV